MFVAISTCIFSIFSVVPSACLVLVKTIQTALWDRWKGNPQPLKKGDHLIEVKFTVNKGNNFRDFEK